MIQYIVKIYCTLKKCLVVWQYWILNEDTPEKKKKDKVAVMNRLRNFKTNAETVRKQ